MNSSTPLPAEPPSSTWPGTGFEDPRTSAEFRAPHFPTANGKPVPGSGAANPNAAILAAFAAAYYRINSRFAELLALRGKCTGPDRAERERTCLQAIERALCARDELEDHYAPYGVIIEPSVVDGFAVDLRCSFGNVGPGGRPKSELVTIKASAPVPLPPGAKLEDFLVGLELPEFFDWGDEA